MKIKFWFFLRLSRMCAWEHLTCSKKWWCFSQHNPNTRWASGKKVISPVTSKTSPWQNTSQVPTTCNGRNWFAFGARRLMSTGESALWKLNLLPTATYQLQITLRRPLSSPGCGKCHNFCIRIYVMRWLESPGCINDLYFLIWVQWVKQ